MIRSLSRRPFILAALASLSVCPPAEAVDATAVLEKFVACKPEFFDFLAANAKLLGTASVHDSPVSDPAQLGAAMLAAPIEAGGLHITGYTHGAPPPGGRSRFYHWGFQVTDAPLDVATAITRIALDAAFRERRGEYGWVMELEPLPAQGVIEHRSPTRMLLVRPSRDPAISGSSIECGVSASHMGEHEILPKVSAMFGAAP